MQLAEAKARFIADWGRFGTNWGINRTMAQIHALLLVSADALSAEEVMGATSHQPGECEYELAGVDGLGPGAKGDRTG